jgi:hypothetical protein
VIDSPPSRVFQWRRPRVRKNYYPLGQRALADLVKYTNIRVFSQMFAALLLEKTIVVYHPDDAVVSHVILALHFMLRPLRWVNGSVSILPDNLAALLAAPTPLLVGQTTELGEMQPWFAYFDLAKQKHEAGGVLLYPKAGEMEKTLRHIWQTKPSKLEAYGEILDCTNGVVQTFLDPVEQALMSQFSQSGTVRSAFFRELYLKRFPLEERQFAEAVTRTQMFQMRVEQDCRRRSDGLSADT